MVPDIMSHLSLSWPITCNLNVEAETETPHVCLPPRPAVSPHIKLSCWLWKQRGSSGRPEALGCGHGDLAGSKKSSAEEPPVYICQTLPSAAADFGSAVRPRHQLKFDRSTRVKWDTNRHCSQAGFQRE